MDDLIEALQLLKQAARLADQLDTKHATGRHRAALLLVSKELETLYTATENMHEAFGHAKDTVRRLWVS